MEETRLDALSRALGRATSRRAGLRAMLAVMLGAAGGATALEADARKKRRHACNPPCGEGFSCRQGVCVCESGGVCGDRCCARGEACVGGACAACASGVSCAGRCCTAGQGCAGATCEDCPGGSACGGTCCLDGERCHKGRCTSCKDRTGCGDVCCARGETCVQGACTCESGVTCNGACCGDAQVCVEGACAACPAGQRACAGTCCSHAETCWKGVCACDPDQTVACGESCCWSHESCQEGRCVPCPGTLCPGKDNLPVCCASGETCETCTGGVACTAPAVTPGSDPAANGAALQAAIDAAAGGAVLQLPSGVYRSPAPGPFTIRDSVTLQACGPGPAAKLETGSLYARSLAVEPAGENRRVVLEGIVVGWSREILGDGNNGAGVTVRSAHAGFRFEMRRTTIDGGFWDNRRGEILPGSGLHLDLGPGGSAEISRSSVRNAEAGPQPGGGIHVASGTVDILDSTILDNDADLGGGGIHVAGGTVTIDGCRMRQNTADNSRQPGLGRGGALYVAGGSVTVRDTRMWESESSGDGGAVYVAGGSLALESGASIWSNQAGGPPPDDTPAASPTVGRGGGVFVDAGTLTIGPGATIGAPRLDDGNTAHGDLAGGGLFNRAGSVTFAGGASAASVFRSNQNAACTPGSCCNQYAAASGASATCVVV